jgi:hypothetical protein
MKHVPIILLFITGIVVTGLLIMGLATDSFRESVADPDQARGMITFIVAVLSAAIILVTTIAIFFLEREDLGRIEEARGLLAVVMSVLATIIGFYFGASDKGQVDNREAPSTAIVQTIGTGGVVLLTLSEGTSASAVQVDDSKGGWIALEHDPSDPMRFLLRSKADLPCPAGTSLRLLGAAGSQLHAGKVSLTRDALKAAGWTQC